MRRCISLVFVVVVVVVDAVAVAVADARRMAAHYRFFLSLLSLFLSPLDAFGN